MKLNVDFESCLFRSEVLATVLFDQDCRDAIGRFDNSDDITDGLRWMLLREIKAAQEAYSNSLKKKARVASAG